MEYFAIKISGLILLNILLYIGWVFNEKLRKSKNHLKQDLVYTLKNYKLYRKSQEQVKEVEALKEKLLKILNEEK